MPKSPTNCATEPIIFAIPYRVFKPWCKKLNITKHDDGKYYYHIRISSQANRFYLQFHGREEKADITSFLLKAHIVNAEDSTLVADLKKIMANKTADPTTVQALVNARVGQGKFGLAVRQFWDHRCSVTGAATQVALEASHIKGWADSTDGQRLDPNNGLLLTANLHKLFDAGLISFDDSGKMLVSSKLSQSEQEIFGVVGKNLAKKPSPETAKYLSYHRKKFLE
jgi:predicted restriction endonuclease